MKIDKALRFLTMNTRNEMSLYNQQLLLNCILVNLLQKVR